ncbi:ATP synthase F0 subunit C [bacterium]|nr:MAG: ATP synthase F0 subunit C [bacterium]
MNGNVIGLGIGIAALGVGIGQGIAANGALQGMARQPEASGKIQTGMLIALAFMELVFLLTFVVSFTAK